MELERYLNQVRNGIRSLMQQAESVLEQHAEESEGKQS
jgi:ElaB/YqjD/DUF883 family membrane-anchored ribosome-binding protein